MTDIYKNYMESLEFDPSKSTFSAYNDQHLTELVKYSLASTSNNDEFYKKLVELKNEQKKTLLYMEDLYNHKQMLKDNIQKSELNLKDIKSMTYPLPKDENYKFNLNTISAYENKPIGLIESEINNFKKVESKPPLPKSSTVTFQNTVTVARENEGYETKTHESISNDLKRIERIWEDFKIDDELNLSKKSIDFNKKFEKRLKNDSKNIKRPSSSIQVEWVPRVTIPEPFSMTIREQIKSEKKKKVAREMQDEREKRIEAELRECSKKFRAQPVPAHVMVPLYEKLKNEEELRKIKLKKMSQEYMEKVSKPFNLTETKKKEVTKERRHSFSEGQTEFNAQPLPEFYFNDELDEKMKELELYKQLKNQMRALELLKNSKMPNNMALYEEKKKLEQERAKLYIKEMSKLQKKVDQSLKKRATSATKSRKQKTHDVPDFDAMYRKFVIELETRKAENRKNTKAEPFLLLTESRTRAKNDEESKNIKRSNSMSRLNKSLSMSMDAFPIKYTETQKLRESITKDKLNDMVRKELQKEHIEKIKKLKEKKLHEQIQDKINYNPKEVSKNFDRQARKLRLEQKAKEEEYEKEIGNMYKSVESRKLQIEQVEEDNIRRAMEKKYKDVLKKVGIDDNLINEKKSTTRVASSVIHDQAENDWINE
ncbi:unnamed protein product [Brachionus calyciflorus]|uniref:FAM161A n=1 Tax=Brachionus calyciflorus TaxID=104777 RepID=A0A814HSI0_9BILA|nr:unnamed protein product [Brachionus calyciflorus]